MIKVKPYIEAISAYTPPSSGLDRAEYLRLDFNENTLMPPKHVLQALKEYLDGDRIQMYPTYGKFMKILSEYVGVPTDHLMVTNGSDQGIEIILRAFLGQGDSIVLVEPAFPMFNQIVSVIGAEIDSVPLNDDLSFPDEVFLNTIKPGRSIIVIINPNNPTGTSVSRETIERAVKDYPDIPVYVDEAYYEFTGDTALDLLESSPNLLISRTFSKAFALAGLRLGYIIARPELISQFHKIRGPFDVNSLALVAAEAQLRSPEEWQKFVHKAMKESKPYLERYFKDKEVTFYPGAAHFMLVKPADRDRAVDYLRKSGILVRPQHAHLIADTFRMSVGTLAQTKRFIEVYDRYLKEIERA